MHYYLSTQPRHTVEGALRDLVSSAFIPQDQMDPGELARIKVPPPGPQAKH